MAPEPTNEVPARSFLESILGRKFLQWSLGSKVRLWNPEFRSTAAILVLALLLLVPFLGAVGLWDPWEDHYGEVGRMMIARNDYLHPFWENSYFFSKPVFTLWMMAAGLHLGQLGPLVALVSGLLGGAAGLALYMGRIGQRSSTKEFWGVVLFAFGAMLVMVWGASLAVSVPWKFGTLTGANGALPPFTEWGFRLPFALFAILALALLTYAMSTLVSARAGLATGLILLTMPLFFLLSRQAVTDTPFMASLISGMSCTMVALLHRATRFRTQWWLAAYAFFALATLAKGLLGFGIPMVVMILYAAFVVVRWTRPSLVAHWAWIRQHLLPAMTPGIIVGVIVGVIASSIGTARGTMFMAVPVVDGRSLMSAATWLGIMWGSLAFWVTTTIGLRRREKLLTEPPPGLFGLAYEMRLGVGILLFLVLALPWYYEMFTFWRVDDESKLFWFRFIIYDHFARLASGVHTTTPGGDFTYFILQGGYAAFPWVVLLPGAVVTFAKTKLGSGATTTDRVTLFASLWLALTFTLIGLSATKFHHYVFPMLPPLAIAMGIFVDRLWEEGLSAHAMELVIGLPFFILVGKDIAEHPKVFTDLFVYNYDRPFPQKEVIEHFGVERILANGMVLMGTLAVAFAALRSKVGVFSTWMAGTLAFAFWFNWSLWVDLSHHWTQREQFWRYFSDRRPGEPIAAFLMNWRGETFYSRNTVKQIREGNTNLEMAQYAALPGRKWALVEHNRLNVLRGVIGSEKTVTLIDRDLNNKFVLVTIE